MPSGLVEFQGIVLVGGYGTRMPDLTDDVPKPLLPVANVPMFWYALNTFWKNKIYNVLVLTNERCHSRILQLMSDGSVPQFPKPMNIEYVNTGAHGRDWGTMQALCQVSDKIKHDFILFSGDVISDLNLAYMLEQHRAEDAEMTLLLTENKTINEVPGPKDFYVKYRDFAMLPLAENPPKLLYMVPEEDFEDIPPNSDLFRRYRNVTLTANYENCNVIVMKRGLLNLLKIMDDSFTSINTDFIPYLTQLQHVPDREINDRVFGKQVTIDDADLDIDEKAKKDLRRIKCFAFLNKVPSSTIMYHCNTLAPYFAANKAVLQARKQFFADDMIEYLRLERKDSGVDSRSSVHMNVEISSSVKVIGSVIMRGCKIGNNCQIINSIVSENAVIGDRCVIKNSLICAKEIIPEGTRHTNSLVRTLKNIEI